jgi:hypothetical protein
MKVNSALNKYIRISYANIHHRFVFKHGFEYLANTSLTLMNNASQQNYSTYCTKVPKGLGDIINHFQRTNNSALSDLQNLRKELKVECRKSKDTEDFIRDLSNNIMSGDNEINSLGRLLYKFSKNYIMRKESKAIIFDESGIKTLSAGKDLLKETAKRLRSIFPS